MSWFARFVEPDQPLTPPGKSCWSNYRHSSCFLNEVLNNSESANTQHVLCKLQVSNQSAFSNNIRCPPENAALVRMGPPCLLIDYYYWLHCILRHWPPDLICIFFLNSPHLCSLQASRHKWQLHPFSFFFFLLFKRFAIAHPFQASQNPTRYSSYELLSKLGPIYHMMDHWAWYCLLGILDKLLSDRFFFSLGWPHIHFSFRLHPVFFSLNFVMLLKWGSSIRILSQILWYSKYESRNILSTSMV